MTMASNNGREDTRLKRCFECYDRQGYDDSLKLGGEKEEGIQDSYGMDGGLIC